MDLALDAVTVEAAGRKLVDALSLKAGDGEVVGLVGPNGSGKSTALRCVYRALTPSAGAVLAGGSDLSGLSNRDSARLVAAVTQEAGTDLDFTVADVVAMGRFPHHPGNRALSERERDLVHRCLERTGVAHLAGRGILSLSGGERQRVLIARALAQEPRILVLDEPTNHLDVRHQVELLSFLRACGLTVLVALHDLNIAAATCDRVAVLHNGRLAAAGPPVEVLTPDLVRRVFGVTPVVVTHPVTGAPQLLWTFTDRGGSP
ncbi:ABC transporter ATP-binding protein [Amycolatopsis thermoflava]|uniref:ABC transporter ATP-binding protein n=1 Tax=Amycolatopsis thermoflava TaxID=84480 RepID=UPI003EBCB71F